MVHKSEYKTLYEWKENNPNDYKRAYNRGFIDKICIIYGWNKLKVNGYWTKEKCIEEAKNYKTIKDWNKHETSSVQAARRNDWLDECTKHMIRLSKPNGYWTKERCLTEAKKYNLKKDWRNCDGGSYIAANRLGIYDECIKHMEILIKPKGYWNKERCITESKKYKTIKDWKSNSPSSFNASTKSVWYNESTEHMIKFSNPVGYWTKEKCIEEAKKYNTKKDWRIHCYTSLRKARKNGWLDECTKHM